MWWHKLVCALSTFVGWLSTHIAGSNSHYRITLIEHLTEKCYSYLCWLQIVAFTLLDVGLIWTSIIMVHLSTFNLSYINPLQLHLLVVAMYITWNSGTNTSSSVQAEVPRVKVGDKYGLDRKTKKCREANFASLLPWKSSSTFLMGHKTKKVGQMQKPFLPRTLRTLWYIIASSLPIIAQYGR